MLSVLTRKTILIISPQSWGKMFVSKHHYAIELAKLGNTVFFLNPPDIGRDRSLPSIEIHPSEMQENLFLIDHRISFPYNIKFHFISLFHLLMRSHISQILKKIGRPVDIVWSFDLGNLYAFSSFPNSCLKIFHPVDEPLNQTAINSAKGAQIIFSVTGEILEKYRHMPVPGYFINHGVAQYFFQGSEAVPNLRGEVHVGFSGNLLREDIDRDTFLEIISGHPEMIFDCWGSFEVQHSNIGGRTDPGTQSFLQKLKQLSNVRLHGVLPARELALAFLDMDAFLVCYDVERDQSKGTNYHKIMEYLSTGKVIISSNISTYQERPELVQMVKERDNNRNLPALFSKIMNDLEYHNSQVLTDQRRRYSQSNTYTSQIERIDAYISRLPGRIEA